MKKIIIILLMFLIVMIPKSIMTVDAKIADAAKFPEVKASVSTEESTDDLLKDLDLSDLEEILKNMTDAERAVIGNLDIKTFINKIVNGEQYLDFKTVFTFIFSLVGINLKNMLPLLVTILIIGVAYNIINSIKGNFASKSVENIIYFAFLSLIIILVFTETIRLVINAKNLIFSLQRQINVFFPIILTLMTAIGSSSTVLVYQPAIAILSAGIVEIVVALALPAFIFTLIFSVIGNLSDGLKLKNLSGFVQSGTKWVLNTCFFVFAAFLSVKGITASVYDGISIRTAKFAISKYVPIIGGYLSEGFNLIMAGSVLIKNAVGIAALVLIFLSVAPFIVQISLFSLALKLTSGLLEPLGGEKFAGVISSVASNIKLLISIILGVAFMYFIFIVLIICTGNLAL